MNQSNPLNHLRTTGGVLRGLLSGASLSLLIACGGPAPLGGDCKPDKAEACEEGLVCDTGTNTCLNPFGASCDPSAEETQCETGSKCIGEGESGTCGLGKGDACDPADDTKPCAGSFVCAELSGGDHACYAPVVFAGQVTDLTDGTAIAGAHVIAQDNKKVPVTDVAVSDELGNYSLEIPAVRDDQGAPVSASYFLRSSAADYQTFPGGLRNSLPIEVADATAADDMYTVQTSQTNLALIPLPTDEQGQPSISGKVSAGDASAGVLVVADSGTAARSALSDLAGSFVIFNVPAGDYEVRGYKVDIQLTPTTAAVVDTDVENVELAKSDEGTATVSGSVNIVDPGDGSATSVVLAVKATFDEAFGRGEIPTGLRSPSDGAPDVTGAWTITGVPDGEYVILAGFENDHLIRDPDTNIAGTGTVGLTVPDATDGRDITVADAFKITGALAVVSPGADGPELVTEPVTLSWEDDSSEAYYSVQVFDSFGEIIWEDPRYIPAAGAVVSVEVTGVTFEPGLYYQFRATSWREPGGVASPISTTEDLKGVFYFAAPE